MDPISRKLFENPSVRVGGYREDKDQIESACNVIFGRTLTASEFVDFIAAPDGSDLTVQVEGDIESIKLRISYHWFGGTHEYFVYSDNPTGARIVEFQSIAVLDNAPELLETRIFARQVLRFRKYGIERIQLFAEGYPNHPNGAAGYYVWARLGFMMTMDGLGSALARDGYNSVWSTLDLFSRPGGAQWWYNNGRERPAVFYLDENSPCSIALQAYLEEKGVDVDGEIYD